MSLILSHALWLPIEGAINSALAHKPACQQYLAAHVGKQIQVHIQPKLTFEILVLTSGVRLGRLANNPEDNQAYIQGYKLDFIRLLLAQDKPAYLLNSRLHTEGDHAFLQALLEVLAELELDWFAWLAPYTNSSFAAYASQGLASMTRTFKQCQHSSSAFASSLCDFLQQESTQLVSQQQVDEFCQQVNELTQRTQALSDKISALTASTGTT